MKKLTFIFCFILLATFSFSKDLAESIPAFRVISDEFDATIPKGSYILEGTIIDAGNGQSILGKVQIQVVDGEKLESKKAHFRMTIPLGKTFVAFNKSKYQRSYFEYYEVKDQHRIKVFIYMSRQGKTPQISEEKPVIYAYSELEVNFELTLKQKGDLTFVYPALPANNTWKMKTLSNGSLQDENGLEFPYLFWESERKLDFGLKQENDKFSGQFVVKSNVVHFLDSILSYLNFNPKEKTDFITYWGPKLASNNYNFVQFVVREDCDAFAAYEISPKPDVFNRLYMIYTGFENFPGFIRFEPQKLLPFERKGFHLLEWGGMTYPQAYFDLQAD